MNYVPDPTRQEAKTYLAALKKKGVFPGRAGWIGQPSGEPPENGAIPPEELARREAVKERIRKLREAI